MKYLIAGLGNIGSEYHETRHNIGFMVLDALAKENQATFSTERHAFYTSIKHKGRTIHLIKPTTYMNLSGKALKYWMQQLKVNLPEVLVVTDDIALPFGKLRMRGKGSAGGHNGLKNIEQLLGSSAYARLKFGVGNDFAQGRQVDYVLSTFDKKEQEELPLVIDKAAQMVLGFCTIGLQRTMSQLNN